MTSASFLFAFQLGDSALPTGRFAHSHGLEELVASEPELSEAELVELIESTLLEIVAPLDGVAVAEAHRLVGISDLDGLLALDATVTARKITPASRQASTTCGRRLAVLAASLTSEPTALLLSKHVVARRSNGNLAVVEGTLAGALGLGREEAVLLELRAASTGLLSAALRLGRISAIRAQALAASLVPTLCAALEIACEVTAAEMRAVGPGLDLAAMRHTRREARLFAT